MKTHEGDELKAWIKRKRWTARKFAQKLGVPQSSVHYWFTCEKLPPKSRQKVFDAGFPIEVGDTISGEGEGLALRLFLKDNNIRSKDIAKKIGVSQQTITNAYMFPELSKNLKMKLAIAGVTIFNDYSLKTNVHTNVTKSDNNNSGKSFLEPSAEYATGNRKRVRIVHAQAYAGYLIGYNDMNYLQSLPEHDITVDEDGNFITFEVKGDSMEPDFPDGCLVDCKELDRSLWGSLIRGRVFMFLHPEYGLQIKVLLKQEGQIVTFRPINPMYKDFDVDLSEVSQLWYFHQKHDTTRDYSRYLVR